MKKVLAVVLFAAFVLIGCSEDSVGPTRPETVKAFDGFVCCALFRRLPVTKARVTVVCADCKDAGKAYRWVAGSNNEGYYEMKDVPPIDHAGHLLTCTAEAPDSTLAVQYCTPKNAGAYRIPPFFL